MWVLNLQAQKLMDSLIILVAKTQPLFLILLQMLWRMQQQRSIGTHTLSSEEGFKLQQEQIRSKKEPELLILYSRKKLQ